VIALGQDKTPERRIKVKEYDPARRVSVQALVLRKPPRTGWRGARDADQKGMRKRREEERQGVAEDKKKEATERGKKSER